MLALLSVTPVIAAATVAADVPGSAPLASFAAATPAPPACAGSEPPLTYQGPEPWAQRYLASRSTWELSRGAGVTVAVLSSGADASHDQLAGSIDPGFDALTKRPGANTDCDGRGTRAAGVIAARRAAGTPIHGIAPSARILPVRVVQRVAQADGSQATDVGGGPAQIAAGITWAVAQGAQVICVTVTTDQDDPQLRAAVAAATTAGALVVSGGTRSREPGAGAGDPDTPVDRYPSAYPEVLAVGAVATNGTLLQASERGPYLDVTAPASGAISTAATGGRGGISHSQPQDDPAMATAAVAGTAALVIARYPDLTPAGLSSRILATALAAPRSATGPNAGSGGPVGTAPSGGRGPAAQPQGAPAAPPVVLPQAAVAAHQVAAGTPVGIVRAAPVPNESGLDRAERQALIVAAALAAAGAVLATTLAVQRARRQRTRAAR
jgi:membrane-anchored mycosin MYCP